MFNALISSSLKDPSNIKFDGEDSDERILYAFRRALITNFDWLFVSVLLVLTPIVAQTILSLASPDALAEVPTSFILVLMAFWYLFTAGFIFQNFLNWYFNVYIITNKRIVDIDFVGLLYKNVSEAPLRSVEDVTSNIGGTTRVIFNYGSVLIQTAAEKREFEFTDVANPSKVRDILSDIVTQIKNGHKL